MLRAVAGASNAVKAIVQDGYPFILPSSGSVAVTTGAITLTTALDRTYANAYMYFPANVFTGATAGFYYVRMSSTTVGTMYTTKYVSGVPDSPTSPTVVTTGAGAYVQDTGLVSGRTYTLPANTMGSNGRFYVEALGPCTNSASIKTYQVSFGGTTLGTASSTTAGACNHYVYLSNNNSASIQTYFDVNTVSGASNVGGATVNTAADITIILQMQKGAALDYMVCGYTYIEVSKT